MSENFCQTQYGSFEKEHKKIVSKVFFSLTFSMIISYLILLLVLFITELFPNSPLWISLVINDCYTIVAIIFFCVFSKSIKTRRPIALSDMTRGKFFLFLCASVPLMIIGALIGNVISTVLGNISGNEVTNAIGTLAEDYPLPMVIVSVLIVAPIFEELLFRKLLIDKISHFGFTFSIFISGLTFGTFHGNFYQVFYGCMLGFVLAFVYCMYGRLRYCILLHSLINFIGFVCPIYLSKLLSSPNFTLNFLAMCYSLLYYICIPFGIASIIFGIKTIKLKYPSLFCAFHTGVLCKNKGFLTFLVFIAVMLALSIFL